MLMKISLGVTSAISLNQSKWGLEFISGLHLVDTPPLTANLMVPISIGQSSKLIIIHPQAKLISRLTDGHNEKITVPVRQNILPSIGGKSSIL